MQRSRRPILLLLAVAAGFAQTPPPSADEKPAFVEGEVRNMITGLPVERAHVSLRRFSNNGFDRFGAQTNAEGKFTISGIPAGNYQVVLERVGYVMPAEITRSQLTLRSDEKKDNYRLKLIPVGAISGRVLDADGAPAEGISVEAEIGNRAERGAVTDDRGQYRIGGLRPGKYRVIATLRSLPIPPEIRTDGTAEVNYGSSYHPGVLDRKSATPVSVGPATDVSGIDIRLVRTPVIRFAGRVSGIPAGARQSSVQLQRIGSGGGSGAQVKPDGSFEIWRLAPGKYTATAFLNQSGEMLRSAPYEFEIGESDVEGVELRIQPPEEVRGQLEFDDDMAKPRPPAQQSTQSRPGQAAPNPAGTQTQQQASPRRITLRDANTMMQTVTANVAEDGSFTLQKVSPGMYQIYLNGYPAFVKSVRLGQTVEDGSAVDLRSGAAGAPLTVTLSSAYATLAGFVNDDKGPSAGARVVVRDTENRNMTNSSMSAADGAYAIKNLAPGKYKLIVLDESVTNLMSSDANLDDLDDRGEIIELRPRETLTRDLKLKPTAAR